MNKYEILKGEDLFRPYYNNSTGQKVNLFWTTSQRFEKEFNDCEYDGLGRLKYLRLKQFSIVEILKETLFENTPFSIPGVSYKGAVGIEYLRKHSSIFQNVTIDAAAPNFIRSYALKLMLFLLQDYNYITEIALPKYRPIKLNELIINLESNASQQNEVDHLLFQFLILKGVLKQSNLLEEIINKRIKDSILTSWQTAKVELEYAPLTVSNEREELASLTRGQIEIKIKESLQDELVRKNCLGEISNSYQKVLNTFVFFESKYYEEEFDLKSMRIGHTEIYKQSLMSKFDFEKESKYCSSCQSRPCCCSDPQYSSNDNLNLLN